MYCDGVPKMTKPIILSTVEWKAIRTQLHKKYPPSYFIRGKMKEKLGFTVREHNAWYPNAEYEKQRREYETAANDLNEMNLLLSLPPDKGYTVREIHLDFYDEKKKTMFILTYIGR